MVTPDKNVYDNPADNVNHGELMAGADWLMVNGGYYTWIAREHCLVMTGYDNYYYYFNDPWTNARTRYSKSLVNTRYNELGKQAVVMVKK